MVPTPSPRCAIGPLVLNAGSFRQVFGHRDNPKRSLAGSPAGFAELSVAPGLLWSHHAVAKARPFVSEESLISQSRLVSAGTPRIGRPRHGTSEKLASGFVSDVAGFLEPWRL